jgi:hypothetical protein
VVWIGSEQNGVLVEQAPPVVETMLQAQRRHGQDLLYR